MPQGIEKHSLFIHVARVDQLEDLLCQAAHFEGLPEGCGVNFSMSLRRTSTRPPIFSTVSRPRLTKCAIACRETLRSLAASACEIHSSGSLKRVDIVNLFCYSVRWTIIVYSGEFTLS